MPTLNIVLIEPQIPQNTGNIARTCAATGARRHLLDITTYPSSAAFFAQNEGRFYYFSTKAQQTYTEPQYPDNTYLVFGREDRGLPEELLHANPECCVRLPMIAGARSLNLSNTVAVAVYEALRQWEFPELQNAGKLTKYEWNG